MAKRTYNFPVEIRTEIPCKDREDFLSAVRIASSAKCIDRTATCGTNGRITFKANCASKAAVKKFEVEVGYVVQFLARRPK